MNSLLFILATAESSGFFDNLPAIITSFVALASAYYGYNQYSKNKETDRKMKQLEREDEERRQKRSDDSAKIYGILWELLRHTQADRVYIIQPHPLTKAVFITVRLEVKMNGVSGMSGVINKFPMDNIAAFVSELSRRDMLIYKNIADLKDVRARALFSTNGTNSLVVRRMVDADRLWVGSLVCDFINPIGERASISATDASVYVRGELIEAAENIQYILPEIQ